MLHGKYQTSASDGAWEGHIKCLLLLRSQTISVAGIISADWYQQSQNVLTMLHKQQRKCFSLNMGN